MGEHAAATRGCLARVIAINVELCIRGAFVIWKGAVGETIAQEDTVSAVVHFFVQREMATRKVVAALISSHMEFYIQGAFTTWRAAVQAAYGYVDVSFRASREIASRRMLANLLALQVHHCLRGAVMAWRAVVDDTLANSRWVEVAR